jgi:hypothetical protein
MNYGLIISHRFPNADASDFTVIQEPDQEPQLTYWNEAVLGPRPTDDQFRFWWLAAEKWQRKRQFRHLCDADYENILAPEGDLTLVQRDEVIEKRREIGGEAM